MDPDQTAPTGAEANTVDPDQTAPEQSDLDPHCLSMRLQIVKWTTKNIHFVIIRFNKCEFSVYTIRIFKKCTHVCAAQKAY